MSALFIVSCDNGGDDLTIPSGDSSTEESTGGNDNGGNGESSSEYEKVPVNQCPGHVYEIIEETKPDCTTQGYQLFGCKFCVRTYENTPKPLGHQMGEKEVTPATCGKEGYAIQRCQRPDCIYYSKVITEGPTNQHRMSDDYQLISNATYFTPGARQKYCKNKCGFTMPEVIPAEYDLTKLEIGDNDINIGGIDYVNVSSCGISYATSIYRTTKTANAFDGDPLTYWMADTLVSGSEDTSNNDVHDGVPFTGDVLTYTLAKPFTVGQIRMLVPNYYAWDIGVDVAYEVSVRTVDGEGNESWVNLGEFSASDIADPKTENVYLTINVDTSKQINEIKFKVTKASRYAPAKINEVEIFAQTTDLQRVVKSIASTAGISVTGKWNDYMGGADALVDGALSGESGGWGTDYRRHVDANDTVKFDEQRLISTLKFKADFVLGETFAFDRLVITEGKESWQQVGSYTFKEEDEGKGEYEVDLGGAAFTAYGLRMRVIHYGIQDDSKPTLKEVTYTYTAGEDPTEKTDTLNGFEFDLSQARSYATFEWSSTQYIISIFIALTQSDAIVYQLQYWDDVNSKWEVYKFPILDEDDDDGDGDTTDIVRYVDCIPQNGKRGQKEYNFLIDSNGDGCINTDDVGGLFTKKIRIELTKAYTHSPIFVYEVTPNTVIEQTGEQVSVTGCKHGTYDFTGKKVVKPTCTTIGYTYFPCENCDEAAWISDSVDALGHTWVTKSGTITDDDGNVCIVEKCTECLATRNVVETYKTDLGDLKAPEVTKYLYNAPGAWSMTYDDGNYYETYDWVTPVLERYGARATIMFTITMGSDLAAQWREYFAGGNWDLGSHSYTHSVVYVAKNEKGLMYEVNDAHYKLMSMFSRQRLLTFATPMGTTSDYAAEFYNDFMAAGRNGSENDNYNNPDKFTHRKNWGNMMSFTSKSNRHAGKYVFIKKSDVANYSNFVYNPETGKIQNQTEYLGGTYIQTEYGSIGVSGTKYQDSNHKDADGNITRFGNDFDDTGKVYEYRWSETGSYKKEGDKYVFVNDDSGEYILVHTELGSYENGANQVVSNGYWVVECKHCIGQGPINHSYTSFLQQMEALKQTGVWVGSYTDVTQYTREAMSSTATIEVEDGKILLTLTDEMDDALFNHRLTVKVDIPDTWNDVTVMQGETQIGLENAKDVYIEADENGNKFVYVSVVPDTGVVTISQK
jgi:hypothetical protein